MINEVMMNIPQSQGYIIVDSKKCQGCQCCMMACSFIHEGEVNLSLARIQVMQNILENWPDDIRIVQCRQCVDPACVEACPADAFLIDEANGYVRIIDALKCTGCQFCIDACPFKPQRIIWNPETSQPVKCDLCINTPYWDEKGGPDGRQICVDICPQGAIKFTGKVPDQTGDSAYDIDFGENEPR